MRDAVLARIHAVLPSLRAVKAHGGDFSAAELERFMTNAPAVFVASRGAVGIDDVAGEIVVRDQWAACVVTRDLPSSPEAPHTSRGDLGRAIAREIARLVARERWNGTASKNATNVVVQNLYSAPADQRGTAFWLVSWEQPEDDSDAGFETLDDLLRIHTDYDLSPKDDVVDAADLTEFQQGD